MITCSPSRYGSSSALDTPGHNFKLNVAAILSAANPRTGAARLQIRAPGQLAHIGKLFNVQRIRENTL